jgi:1-acyl-sn-glycerol-3-phosphate acyltransferase
VLSFSKALALMQAAFESGNIASLRASYSNAKSEVKALRIPLWLVERFYPITPMLETAERFDGEVRDRGLHGACCEALSRLGFPWEPRLEEGIAETLASGPVVFYGNHPSMLTPFLLSASVERPDLRIAMMSYVTGLIPSLSERTFPLELPRARPLVELRRGGGRRLLASWLISRLRPLPARTRAKAINRRSLEAAADHVRDGGCVAIFPDGGGKRNRYWYPGIGVLVKALTKSPGDRPIHLVPIRERHGSNRRVYATLGSGPVARIKRTLLYRSPIQIEFAKPIALADLPFREDSSHQIASRLRQHYEALFPAPART